MSDPAWSDHPVVRLVTEDLLAALNETFEQTGGFSPRPICLLRSKPMGTRSWRGSTAGRSG